MFPRKMVLSRVELKSAIIRKPLVVSPNTPVIEAIAKMSDLHSPGDDVNSVGSRPNEVHPIACSSCVFVVDDGTVVGMLTERDVVRLSAQQQPLNALKIEQVMTHPVTTLRESAFTDFSSVLDLFHKHRIRHLPILDERDYPIGLVTYSSLQQAITRHTVQTESLARQDVEYLLQESEQRYASLMDAAPVGIFRTNVEGYCVYVNERYCQITGYTPGNLIGEGWQPRLHPEDRAWVIAEWQRSIQTGQLFQLECRYQKPDNTYRWVYAQAVPEREPEGQVVGYVGTLTDITNHKRDEVALRNLIEGTAAATGQDFFPALV
ncbi:MAG: PAS domain-containing protein, partial [Leptolyngbya sp. SIO1D8]|nr:PAS domain-containing protein [Leptolyngbya sp. SIO1D8]